MTRASVPADARPAPGPTAGRAACWAAALVGLPLAGLAWGLAVGSRLPDQPAGTCAAGALLALLAVCTYTDLIRHKIYNWSTYTAALWALALNACFPFQWGAQPDHRFAWLGPVGLFDCLAGAALTFVVMLLVFRLSGARGAGDVKLATAVGAWLGLERGTAALVYTYAAAGVFLLCWVLWTEGPVKVGATLGRRVGSLVAPGRVAPPTAEQRLLLQKPVPMAAFFAAGTLAALLGAPFSL